MCFYFLNNIKTLSHISVAENVSVYLVICICICVSVTESAFEWQTLLRH